MTIGTGLDFGTTNSTIGYNDGVKAGLINLGIIKKETRTVLFVDEEEKEFIVGTEGIEKFVTGIEGRLIQSPKSHLKTNTEVKTDLLGKTYKLTEIISLIITDFKRKLEKFLDHEVDSVLIGRPVNFHDSDLTLDKLAQDRLELAAKLAGFKNVEFQLEPLAAAKIYQSRLNKGRQENVFVVDLGGGTCDFSILNMSSSKISVIGNSGIYIGGDDFDRKLSYDFFCELLGKGGTYKFFGSDSDIPSSFYRTLSDWKKIHELGTPNNRNKIIELYKSANEKIKFGRLREIAEDHYLGYQYFKGVERSKKELSMENIYSSSFDFFSNPFNFNISRIEFERIISNDVKGIIDTIKELLIQSGLDAESIDKVFITGGSSLIPIIKNSVEEILGKGKIVEGDIFTSVGYGLTLESNERFR